MDNRNLVISLGVDRDNLVFTGSQRGSGQGSGTRAGYCDSAGASLLASSLYLTGGQRLDLDNLPEHIRLFLAQGGFC